MAMKNPFIGMSVLEKLGFVTLILSVVFMVARDAVDVGPLSAIMDRHEMVFWAGLLLWALGYLQRERRQ